MHQLNAQVRKIIGKKVKRLRRQSLIPAVIYGHKIKPLSLVVSLKDFEKVYKQAGESDLIELKIDNQRPVNVLIHDVQRHPVTDRIIHVDFYQIKAGEKITVDIKLKLVGEAPAVKEKGNILVPQIEEIKVECLPKDIVHDIAVDISNLKEVGDTIRIKDLKIPPTLKILNKPEDVVVTVEAPMKEEITKPVEEEIIEKPTETEEKEKEKAKSEKVEEK